MDALNTDSPLPLYHQLARWLDERIESGAYPCGSRIPSEPELARSFGIGRPTVRQATDVLVRRHRLERRRGSGTFVVAPPERVDLFSLAGTMASFEKGGVKVRTTLVKRPRRTPVKDQGDNPFAGREAVFFSRLSRVKQVPVLLEEIYIDSDRFPGVERLSFADRSLSEQVERHFHMRPVLADQNFRVVSLDTERARLLERSPGESILLVRRTLHFKNAQGAIFSELFCRTDQLVFSQTLEGVGND